MQAYSAPLNMSLSNVLCKTKNFQTWNQKCLVCVILGFKFKKLLSYLKSAASNLSKKERTPTQVFSGEFCEVLKRPFLHNTIRQLLLFYGKIFYQQNSKEPSVKRQKNRNSL